MIRTIRIIPKEGYKERAQQQALAWAQGNPYHNTVDDECCPDFGCCVPSLFTKDENTRWETYRKQYKSH